MFSACNINISTGSYFEISVRWRIPWLSIVSGTLLRLNKGQMLLEVGGRSHSGNDGDVWREQLVETHNGRAMTQCYIQ